MSKAFRTNINLAGNQLLGAAIWPLSTAPATNQGGGAIVAGQMYYNSTGSTLNYYNGSAWVQLATGSTALASLNGLTVATTLQGTANQITVTTSSPNITLSFPTAGVTLPGKTTLTAGTTSASSLNIPFGAAPTSPANGDIWLTQATGLAAQYGGTPATHVLADLDTAQTLASKTLTTPTINGAALSGTFSGAHTISGIATFSAAPVIATITNTGTITLPTSTDTLVGRATTDALSNKTLILSAGTATVAPVKFTPTSAVLMTTPATGNMEIDSSGNLYYSPSSTRYAVPLSTSTYTLGFTTTANTALTLPTSGTLVNTAVTSLSSLTTIGTGTGLVYSTSGALSVYTTSGTGTVIPTTTSASLTTPSIAGGTLSGITALAIRDTSAAFDVTLAATSSTALTAGRTLTLDMINAARSIKLAGNIDLSGNFTTTGSNALTLTTTGATTATLPSGTNTLAANNQAFFIGTQSIAINATSGTITALPGVASVNGISLTPLTTGFTVAGGSTTSKTLTVSETLTLTSASSGNSLNIGTGGTLGSAAFTASTAYAPTAGSTSITTVGTITAGTWTGTDIALDSGGTNATLTATAGGIVYSTASAMAISAAGTSGYLLTSAGTSAPTWTQSTATNVNSAVVQRDGSGNIAVSQVTVSADPSQALQVATKQYVDNIASGINAHDSVVAASTAALTVIYANGTAGVGATLTNAGTQAAFTLDNVTLLVGDRVLIKNQASTTQNGIYTVTTVGTGATNWVLTRASDYDQSTPGEVAAGDQTFVVAPAAQFSTTPTQQNTGWIQNTPGTITIGTSAISFVQGAGSGSVTAGNGITVSGNQVAVNLGSAFDATNGTGTSGLSLSSGTLQVRLDAAGGLTSTTAGLKANLGTGLTISSNAITFASGYGVRKFTGSITGDTTTVSFPITHSLGTNDVTVRVYQTSTTGNPDTQYADIEVDITRNTTNQVTIGFATAPAVAHTYNVVVIG
jgi:hypothetical protein